MRRLIDLSHPIEEGMTTHPGIPAPTIRLFMTHEQVEGLRFHAAPVAVQGGMVFPVRAYAVPEG